MYKFICIGCIFLVGCSGTRPRVGQGLPGSTAAGRTEIHMPPRKVEPFYQKKSAEKKDDTVLIREQIAQNASYIKYLQAKYKKIYPDLTGKVDVELTVDEFGAVESCKVVYQSLGAAEMINDIVVFLEGMKFKGLITGDIVVGYQFFF